MDINRSPRMTRYLVEMSLFRADPLFLVDVGVSGGIEPHWRGFGSQLAAVGFDPLVNEVERLNSAEKNPAVRYVASLVGCHVRPERDPGEFYTDNFGGSSTVWARELQAMNYANTYYDQTHSGDSTTELVELDEFLAGKFGQVDFIKTDTDCHDIEVLRGARQLLSTAGPMGLEVEVLFLGPATAHSSLFSNIDIFLRNLGYSVFAIEPRFHTRAALPGMFRWFQPADTLTGRAAWGNTVFFRDVCLPDYEKRFGFEFTPSKLLKLCCLHELYGFPDCAAEVLLRFRDRLRQVVDVDRCLDLLTPPLPDGRQVPYAAYIDFFKNNIKAFYSGK